MYFNKIAITLLVIFSICASFVIGFFSKDIYNQIREENKRSAESIQRQFLMQINSDKHSGTTTYEQLIKERVLEAERLRRN